VRNADDDDQSVPPMAPRSVASSSAECGDASTGPRTK
jgi:hypothetical protein